MLAWDLLEEEKALRVVENLERILAVELLCAAQALDFRRPLKSTAVLETVHSIIREKVAFASEDRIFSEDINTLTELIQSRVILKKNQDHTAGISEYDEQFEKY